MRCFFIDDSFLGKKFERIPGVEDLEDYMVPIALGMLIGALTEDNDACASHIPKDNGDAFIDYLNQIIVGLDQRYLQTSLG